MTPRQFAATGKIFSGKNIWVAYPFSLWVALQQVSWLVILQVADAGIGSSVQQELKDLLLIRVTMKTRRHV